MSSKFELEHKKLFKAEFVVGKTFRLVMINPDCEQDANFVIELRNRNSNYNILLIK